MKTSLDDHQELVFHPDGMEWEPILDEKIGQYLFDKKLIDDQKAGMVVNFCRYPAGFYKAAHTHTCSHGIYVISGKLKTETGVYGPGHFVWHPEGSLNRHGATEKEDCFFLFVTNGPFTIAYPDG